MDLKIFDVEHGACSLLTCDNYTRIMFDAGQNSTTRWKPGDYLRQNGITELELLVITNYDEDHANGIRNLFDSVYVKWLGRNASVSTAILRNLKSEDGMGDGIATLCHAMGHTFTGGTNDVQEPYYQGLERQVFCCNYPEFDDENNLSMVNFLDCHGRGVMFTGDLEKPGWEKLAENSYFVNAMNDTNVLIAPHHGRISQADRAFFSEFYKKYFPNVYYVVISDKGYAYDTQQTIPLFKSFAKGGPFRGETRYVLTTRNDGRIGFNFELNSWHPY